jgi:transposase
MRRTHLRGHANILKRLLVHAGAFNLGLLMRKAFGRGTPRGLQGRQFDVGALEITLGTLVDGLWTAARRLGCVTQPIPSVLSPSWTLVRAC